MALDGSMTFQGPYAAHRQFGRGDVVTSGNVTYVSTQDGNSGNTPATSPNYWAAIGQLPA